MHQHNHRAEISFHTIKMEFHYNTISVLTLSVTYPQIGLYHGKIAQDAINGQIKNQINAFVRDGSETLFNQGVEQYKESLENDFPFFPFDAVLQYEITYNENCHFSLYRDQYQYTGGAHGITTRSSDTWNLDTGDRLPLAIFFKPPVGYREFMLKNILQQATQNFNEEPIYFDDYRTLIANNFNQESYYLTREGIAVYFQQYEIAPYSTGIVVFVIPYQ